MANGRQAPSERDLLILACWSRKFAVGVVVIGLSKTTQKWRARHYTTAGRRMRTNSSPQHHDLHRPRTPARAVSFRPSRCRPQGTTSLYSEFWQYERRGDENAKEMNRRRRII
jgi:hypothetical protein